MTHAPHTFGTHAALFGVNPWRLQSWMGHKRIDETMIYVHVAENHRREIPDLVVAAGELEKDPWRKRGEPFSRRWTITPRSSGSPSSLYLHSATGARSTWFATMAALRGLPWRIPIPQ